MTAPLKTIEGTGDITGIMQAIGRKAKKAAHVLALAPAAQKDRALAVMTEAIHRHGDRILAANSEDVADARAASIEFFHG